VRALLSLTLLAPLAAGCGKTMTEDDCRRIGEHLTQAWDAEAKKAAPTEGEAAEKASGVLKSEQEKLLNEWAAECKKDFAGRRVDANEMDCILAAKTLEQITKCAER
jgi:hypothetical protein